MNTTELVESFAQCRELYEAPAASLGRKPKIRNNDDAETALHELAYLNAVESATRAKVDEHLKQINDLLSQATKLDSGQTLRERRSALEDEILRWGDDNRAELCPKAKKSVALRHGKLSWRKDKDGCTYLDGWDKRETIVAAAEGTKILAKIEALLDKLELHGVIQCGLTVNLTNARNARQNEQLDDDQLADIGLQFNKGEEHIKVEATELVRVGP